MALQWIGYIEACILLVTKRLAGSPMFRWRKMLEGVKIRFRLPSMSRAGSSRPTERFHGRKTPKKRQPVRLKARKRSNSAGPAPPRNKHTPLSARCRPSPLINVLDRSTQATAKKKTAQFEGQSQLL